MPRRAALLFLLAVAGCGSGMSDQAYADEFRKAAEGYKRLATEMDARMAASPAGADRDAKLEALAERVESDAARLRTLADGYRQLSPPEKYKALHRKMTTFLDLNVAGLDEDAATLRKAIRTGKREDLQGTVREAALVVALQDVQAEARRLALPPPFP